MNRDGGQTATLDFHGRIAAGQADQRVLTAIRLATFHKVETRAAGMAELHDFDGLRELAAQIKQHTLDHLPQYLDQFVASAARAGAHVHFAADAHAARRTICDIARAAGAKLAVKAKSMATEEIHLNVALEAAGVRTVETDLGEFIVQIDHDRPSHIVTPIIHKDRKQIAAAMHRELGCKYTEDPAEITALARAHLRDGFRRADLGVTGVNFAIAETGTIVICTNEGNGRMTTTVPRIHVALCGIEKLIPRMSDLTPFLKLLARSSTGQPLTVYTNLVNGPRRPDDPDGPEQVHIVLLDNGRSRILSGPLAEVLRCIRCGACLNACPVYRNIGGHAYGGVYPGPIGALVTPLLGGLAAHHELPRASSLCGACRDACPVKIDIPKHLVALRAMSRAMQPPVKRMAMRAWGWAIRSTALYRFGQWCLRALVRRDKDGWIRRGPGPLGEWTASRDLPPPPARTFRELWRDELRGGR